MKVYIWGAGRLVGLVLGKNIMLDSIEGFIDNDESKHEFMGKKVFRPIELLEKEYDAIVVATLYAKEIKKQCEEIGLCHEKMIYLYNNCVLSDMNTDYDFVGKILGKEYAEIVKKRHHMIRGIEPYGDLCFDDSPFVDKGYIETDYIRSRCFELVVKEIRKRNVYGNVAELGVFKGEFAQYINYAFPQKTCYLFDTFDGFDANEALKEIKSGNCTPTLVEAYKQTNLKIVLDRMIYLDNVVIKQGYFPQSLDGLEDSFAFVSIDVDFEDSIYEGLKYFYPRLSKGGYIFVHDYNGNFRGVEKAVDRFENENNICLSKVPLCDNGGTLVITK